MFELMLKNELSLSVFKAIDNQSSLLQKQFQRMRGSSIQSLILAGAAQDIPRP